MLFVDSIMHAPRPLLWDSLSLLFKGGALFRTLADPWPVTFDSYDVSNAEEERRSNATSGIHQRLAYAAMPHQK
jgi:hypothetical protein